MTIVVTGGGSGGHITPILAVAKELKRADPTINVVYIGQRGDGLGDIPAQDPNIDKTYAVYAGKFRRYNGEGLKQLLDVVTILKNIGDGFRTLAGLLQALFLLSKIKPNCVFIKGGFVGVPVGFASAIQKRPYVTHDSDAIPGLANRLIARWTAKHAVALPKEVYKYPARRTVTVGVPVNEEFQNVDEGLRRRYKAELEVSENAKVLFVTGGGLGAERVNEAVINVVPDLLETFKNLYVFHNVGRANEKRAKDKYEQILNFEGRGRVVVKGFITDLYRYSGAADLVIARAGATNLAELAVQGKASIIVPNPFLTGGHQLKNAEYLDQKEAVKLLTEAEIKNKAVFLTEIRRLLDDDDARNILSQRLRVFAQPDAAKKLAMLLLDEATKR